MSEDNNTGKAKGAELSPHDYWRKNIKCVLLLLLVWFTVSLGCGVLFVDYLDQWRLPGTGFKLGFWFAQQGSIYVFVVLIWIYVRYMNHLDKKLGIQEKKKEVGEEFEI